MSSDRSAMKRGEQSLEFLFTYQAEEKRKRQQEAADSTTTGMDGMMGQNNAWNNLTPSSGYRLHHQLRNSLRDFSYQDVPATIRNRLKESKSHRLMLKDVECEVYDWVFQHLEERKCPYSLAVALAARVAKASLEKLTSQPSAAGIQVNSISSTSPHHPISESSPAAAATSVPFTAPSSSPSSPPPPPSSSLPAAANENPIGFVADSSSLKKESLDTLFSICSEFAGKSAAETAQLCDQFDSGLLSSTSAIRNARRSMEDRHVVIHDLNKICNINSAKQYSYYAVFDGHAGVDAATYAAAHLHHNLVSSQAFRDGDVVDALKIAFKVTDADFLERSALTNLKSGCTAICCLKQGNEKLFFAWAGDSQAILVRDGRPVDLTPPHKPDMEQERQRIEEMGGKVIQLDTWRVDGTLAVSRAIGDPDHKPYVTADPEVEVIDLEKGDDFIVIACDGLWDQVTPEEVTQIVYEHLEQSDATDPEEAAEKVAAKLSDCAKKEGSTDNITTIVVFLKDIQSIVSTGKSEYFTMELSSQSNTSLDFGRSQSHSFEMNGRIDDDMTAEEELFSLTHNQLNELEVDGVTTTSCADPPAAGLLIPAEALSSESTTTTSASANGYPDDVMSHDDEEANLMKHSAGTPPSPIMMTGTTGVDHDVHSAIQLPDASNDDEEGKNRHAHDEDGVSGQDEESGDEGRDGKEGGVTGAEAVLLLPTRAADQQHQQQETAFVASVTKELEELVDQTADSADSDSDDESDTDSVQYLVWQPPSTQTTPNNNNNDSNDQQTQSENCENMTTGFTPTPASPTLFSQSPNAEESGIHSNGFVTGFTASTKQTGDELLDICEEFETITVTETTPVCVPNAEESDIHSNGFVTGFMESTKQTGDELVHIREEFKETITVTETTPVCDPFESGQRSTADKHDVIHDLNSICNIDSPNAEESDIHSSKFVTGFTSSTEQTGDELVQICEEYEETITTTETTPLSAPNAEESDVHSNGLVTGSTASTEQTEDGVVQICEEFEEKISVTETTPVLDPFVTGQLSTTKPLLSATPKAPAPKLTTSRTAPAAKLVTSATKQPTTTSTSRLVSSAPRNAAPRVATSRPTTTATAKPATNGTAKSVTTALSKPLAPKATTSRVTTTARPAPSTTLRSSVTSATSKLVTNATKQPTTTSTSRLVSSAPRPAAPRVATSRLTTTMTAKPAATGTAKTATNVTAKPVTTALSKPLASKATTSRLTTTARPATSTGPLKSSATSATSKLVTTATTKPAVSKVTASRPMTTAKSAPDGASKKAITSTSRLLSSTAPKPLASKVSTSRLTTAAAKPITNGTVKSSPSASKATPSPRTAMMTLKKTATTSSPLKASSGSTEPKAVKKLVKTESATTTKTTTTAESISFTESSATATTTSFAAEADGADAVVIVTTNGDVPSNQSVQF